MSVWTRRLLVLCGIVAAVGVAVTGLDKYDERSCRGDLRVARVDTGKLPQYAACDGFLPW